MPHGIEILTAADYFTLSNRTQVRSTQHPPLCAGTAEVLSKA